MLLQQLLLSSTELVATHTSTQCVCILQLSFPGCVRLTPSDSKLQDKRAYHALVLGQGVMEKGTTRVEGLPPSNLHIKSQ